MTRGPLRRCWRKCWYLGGECCVQRKPQVQKPCGRTCKWKSPRCCPNVECPTDIYNAGVILSPSFPSHRVHPKSCWLCFRHLHPICALLCSYPGRAFLTSCVAYGDSLLPNWPPSCYFANTTPSPTFKTEKQPTTDPVLKPCLSLLKSQTSPSHVNEKVLTWLLPASPALSHMLLCSLSRPLQPLSLLLGHQVFLLREASALSSSAWLALSPTLDRKGSFSSFEAPAQMSPSQTTLSKAGHPLPGCYHSPGLSSPQQYRVSRVHCLSPQADCKLREGRVLAWFIASSSVSRTVIKPEKWISTRVEIHEEMGEGESLVPAGL